MCCLLNQHFSYVCSNFVQQQIFKNLTAQGDWQCQYCMGPWTKWLILIFLLHRRSLFATLSVNMSLLEAVTLITIPRWLTSTHKAISSSNVSKTIYDFVCVYCLYLDSYLGYGDVGCNYGLLDSKKEFCKNPHLHHSINK